jgi:glycerophosphoryl diester phosphodiesterase
MPPAWYSCSALARLDLDHERTMVAHVRVDHLAARDGKALNGDVVDPELRRADDNRRLALGDLVPGGFQHWDHHLGWHVEITEQGPRARAAREGGERYAQLFELLGGVGGGGRRPTVAILKVRRRHRKGGAVHLGASYDNGARLVSWQDWKADVLHFGERSPREQGIAVLPAVEPAGRPVEPGEAAALGDDRRLIRLAAARHASIDLLEGQHVCTEHSARADQRVRIAGSFFRLPVLDVEGRQPHRCLPARGAHRKVWNAHERAILPRMATNRATDDVPVYGHRFGGDYGPEGSRVALEKSLARQVDGLECDIILSRDDEVFALHDPYLELSTNLEGWAQDRSADEIDEACIRGKNGEVTDEHPLRLRAVLDLIPPDLPLQLDVKAYADPELVNRTTARACKITKEHGTDKRIEVISFFTRGCLVAVDHEVSTRLVLWADYAPEALVQWVRDRGIYGVSLEGFIFSHDLIDPLHEAGVTISVGAMNSPGQLERLLPMQPDIVVSDCPAEIKECLARFRR